MWKDKTSAKNLIKVKNTYLIEGLNLDRFINSAKNRGITLFDAKKISNKKIIISVSLADSEKFFAIAKELCYNIKKIKEKGPSLFLIKIKRSIGLTLGAIIFSICAFLYNDYIYGFSFYGSGAIYEKEILLYLNQLGIDKFSRFSSIDLAVLEDQILSDNQNLSFVSLEKRGNVLVVNSALSNASVDKLDGKIYSLYSDVDGVIEKIKVYRGTALYKQGDLIHNGDLLVDGYMLIKEQTIKINVIATVSIIVSEEYLYSSDLDGQEEKAILLAQSLVYDKQIISSDITKTKEGNEYTYRVTTKYRQVISVG